MNWEAVAAISEATGVVGVIVSLIYLAHQVRQAGYATKAATVDQITARFMDWMTTNIRKKTTMKYFSEVIPALIEASDDEVMEFYAAIQTLFKIIEEIQYHRFKRLIDDDIWIGWDNWFGNLKSYEVMAYFYELKKDNMSPPFREYWDNLAENPDNNLVSIVRSLRVDASK
jgi:hypothetical protein